MRGFAFGTLLLRNVLNFNRIVDSGVCFLRCEAGYKAHDVIEYKRTTIRDRVDLTDYLDAAGEDGLSYPIMLPFDFTFFGEKVVYVQIATNGWITFDKSQQGVDFEWTHTQDSVGNIIAAFALDLIVSD